MATSGDGKGTAVFMMLLLLPLAGFWLIKPEQMWRTTRAWKYKNPEANEPSEEAFILARVGAALGIVVILIVLLVAATS